jgi:hypothetical protein
VNVPSVFHFIYITLISELFVKALFGWGESGRKESWGRESINLKKLSIVWMQEKSGRKEEYHVGPTKICFLPKVDGK